MNKYPIPTGRDLLVWRTSDHNWSRFTTVQESTGPIRHNYYGQVQTADGRQSTTLLYRSCRQSPSIRGRKERKAQGQGQQHNNLRIGLCRRFGSGTVSCLSCEWHAAAGHGWRGYLVGVVGVRTTVGVLLVHHRNYWIVQGPGADFLNIQQYSSSALTCLIDLGFRDMTNLEKNCHKC